MNANEVSCPYCGSKVKNIGLRYVLCRHCGESVDFEKALKSMDKPKSAEEDILKSIAFEKHWLKDVLAVDGRITYQDIDIAFDAITKKVKEVMKEAQE